MNKNFNKKNKEFPNIDKINKDFKKLFFLNRSLTGEGNIKTLEILNNIVPIKIKKIKSGTKVYDWKIPPEWSIKDGYVKNGNGEKIIDWKKNNLQVVNYSQPIRKQNVSKTEIMSHIHTLPQHKDWIPYRTSYYNKSWGFCTTDRLLKSKKFKEPFEVCIDSSFNDQGSLIYGESFHKGKSSKEILISAYICHPSMANDNLSGILTAVYLFNYIKKFKNFYSYRLVLCPETIGAIAFLKKLNKPKNIVGGCVISTTAGPGTLSLKKSYQKNHFIDLLAEISVSKLEKNWIEYGFTPDGSDERQYSSPGFRIPIITISKSKYHEYKEYHTSADNLKFVKAKSLMLSLKAYKEWFKLLEMNRIFERKMKYCEYQLGNKGLYPTLGGPRAELSKRTNLFRNITGEHIKAFGWIMHLADGRNSVLDMSLKSGIDYDIISESCDIFHKKDLLRVVQ